MNNMVCRLNIYAKANSDRGKNDHTKPGFFLKRINLLLPASHMARRCTRVTVDNSRSDTELSLDIVLQQPLNFPELTEHNCLLTLGLDDVELIEEPIELRCFLTVLLQRLRFKNPSREDAGLCKPAASSATTRGGS